jgi:ABC-type transport system substrate-binding protein
LELRPYGEHWAGPPRAPALRFTTIPDDEMRLAAVTGGSAHATELGAGAAVPAAPEGLAVVPRPARDGAWLMLNHQRAPLGDARVREALSLALDRQALARDHFGPYAIPAGQLLPPGFPGHDPALEPREQDLARAKELLAEVDADEGFRLNIWIPTTARDYLPDPRGTAERVAEMLGEVGIEARVRTDSLRRFLTSRDSGRYTAWIVGWQAQSPDPDNVWYWHFGPARVPAEGQYANDALFRLLLDAQRTVSADEREQMYFSAAQTVHAETPRVVLAHARARVMLAPEVRGFAAGPMGFDDLSGVGLEPGAALAGETPTPAASPPEPTRTAAAPSTVTPDPDAAEEDADEEDEAEEDADEASDENGSTADEDDATASPGEDEADETDAPPTATTEPTEAGGGTTNGDETVTPTPATAPRRGP